MFRFADPYYLLLLLVLPLMIWWYWRGRSSATGKIIYSDIKLLKQVKPSLKQRLRPALFVLRLIAVTLIILALARPQSSHKEEEITTEGIDIVLTMDVSTSMLAEDFRPKNRIEAAKMVAKEFIEGRKNDRIGLVVFAGESFTQCPLTLDYGVLYHILDNMKVADQEWDGTAIGMGLATAINRLKDSKAKSKVIILLTDGRNNRGQIDPITAARMAKAMGIRVYTIGTGTRGTAMYPIDDPLWGRRYVPMRVDIDEDLLKEVAAITGGKYFRATDTEKLREIYKEIGEMEKTKIEVKEYTRYEEFFVYFLTFGLLLLVLELVLGNTYFKKIP
ncbi:double-transmembrane region domain protein [Caldithrix abyssi DSM 13497]|uniref:Ca-activated chloride channel family protein n=1 Tax=Caldithrix abyssi DSM 13497 TaxID=880073 RepID=H1XZ13_CALAY|nr:VWA domain-containing protein [Caldithrix abyssi]APF18037.1 Ca-activated chloride channel family protein [Caldithrix abyssi DSM 13497]EHO42084.1 double-transmembrane region domain protein [Caldithrix abyssi DSM 13497]